MTGFFEHTPTNALYKTCNANRRDGAKTAQLQRGSSLDDGGINNSNVMRTGIGNDGDISNRLNIKGD